MQAIPVPFEQTPAPFAFRSRIGVNVASVITSDPIKVRGAIGNVWYLAVRGDGSPEISTDGIDWFTSLNVRAGDSLYVRLTSSGSTASTRVATVYAPGHSVKFNVTTIDAANVFLTNLSSFWDLSEASGNRADSHGSNTATDTGSVGSTTDATFGTVAVFSGSNYLSVTDHSSIEPAAVFSFSIWIKQTTSVAAGRCVFAKWDGGGGPILHTAGSGDELKMFFTGSGSDYCITSGLGMVADTWYHVVVVYNGAGSTNADRMKIYVDGAQETLSFTGANIPTSFSDNGTALTIGLWPTLSYYWVGRMYRGSFWQRVISGPEASSLYNAGVSVPYGDYV